MSLTDCSVIVVTPVYEDREASGRLFKELAAELGRDVFVVAVDDGSVKQPVEISSLEEAGVDGVVLKLRRNVGHQKAIAIGLGYVTQFIQEHQSIVAMDSDGEDLPSTVADLLRDLKAGSVDIIVAQRKSRVETLKFKTFYAIYKRVFGMMTGRQISFGNFMAMTPSALRRLTAMPELSIHVASAVLASKLRIQKCLLDRGPRYAGRSKMNFVGLVLHGFKGMMVFAEDVLVRVGIACGLIAALAVGGGLLAIVLKLLGFSTPGWFSIAFGILLLVFLQTGALALMTLMMTGNMRSTTVMTTRNYEDTIESVLRSAPVRLV